MDAVDFTHPKAAGKPQMFMKLADIVIFLVIRW